MMLHARRSPAAQQLSAPVHEHNDARDIIVYLRDVDKVYATPAGDFRALKEVNLDIRRGEFLGIIGKSGAGKTTLLNMIAGVSEISSGTVIFDALRSQAGDLGQCFAIHAMSEDERAAWRGRYVGIVYQSFELLPMLDLVDNVLLPQDFSGRYRSQPSRAQALQALELLEIGAHAHKLPSQISGGQRQRVAIARALINDPPLILADEPTGNLDSVTAARIFEIFEDLVAQGKTVVMVTHDRDLARRFSHQLTIVDGRISQDSTAVHGDQISDRPESAEAATKRPTQAQAPTAMLQRPLSGLRMVENENISPPAGYRSKPAVILRHVIKTYTSEAGSFTALNGIDLQLNFGQFISIVGKSGSGKSTLLNMITGIDHPTSGDVVVGGQEIYRMSESQRALWRGREVGIVFQFFQLLPMLTLLENTMLPMDYTDAIPWDERETRARSLLARVGLEQHADKLPSAVSSGQQQSAAIARALAADPPLLVADEPTGNLDSQSAGMIIQLFEELSAQGKTILIVTHDPSLTSRTDQTVIISDGEIIDKTIAKALPLLDHPQLLHATHEAHRRVYEPGAIVLGQGKPVGEFFMIVAGAVDIVLSADPEHEMNLARLGPGQFFGEVELLHGGNAIASARAAGNQPLEVAVLPGDVFTQLLHASTAFERSMSSEVERRLHQNRQQREKKGNGHD